MSLHYTIILYFYLLFLLLVKNQKKYDYIFITAYYPYNSNRHKKREYKKWIPLFFNNVKKNVIVFTDNEGKEVINNYTKNVIRIYTIPLSQIECISRRKNIQKEYEYQMEIDPKDMPRSVFTKLIWNSKICLLNDIANIYISKLYMWIDIGCFRDVKQVTNFPDNGVIMELSKYKMFFFLVNKKLNLKKKKEYIITNNFIQAGFYGGNRKEITKFYHLFWKVHDKYLKKKVYIGTEESIMNTVITFYGNEYKGIYATVKKCGCRNVWWNFIFYVSGKCKAGRIDDIKKFIKY